MSGPGRPRTSSAAGSRGGRRARWRSIVDYFQVDVLEAGRDHAHGVDVLAGCDELADDARQVVPAGVAEPFRAGSGLDLHPALPPEVIRRAGRDHASMVDDDDVVADELDLREEVRVEEHRRPAPTQLLEQAAHDT